jgi:hypothetical protein
VADSLADLYLRGETKKEKNQHLSEMYRNVFTRDQESLLVLTAILQDLRYFDHNSTSEDQTLCNFAKKLLARCGVGDIFSTTKAILQVGK